MERKMDGGAVAMVVGAAVLWLVWRGLRAAGRFATQALHDVEAHERNRRNYGKLKRAR